MLTAPTFAGADTAARNHFTHTLYLIRHGAYDSTPRLTRTQDPVLPR
jgi:hypothetical protein